MDQKKLLALLICIVVLCVHISLPVFSDENSGTADAEMGNSERIGDQAEGSNTEHASQEEIYIEIETEEDNVSVDEAEHITQLEEEETKPENVPDTTTPEADGSNKGNLQEQDAAAQDAVIDKESMESENTDEELEALYNEYIEGFGDNETQKQLFSDLMEEKKATGVEITREIFSEIMAEVISVTYDEILEVNQFTDTQNIIHNSNIIDRPLFPTPVELPTANQADSMPYVSISPYEQPHSMVVNKGKVYAAGTIIASSLGVETDQWAISRVPVQCVDETGNYITNVKTVSLGYWYSLILKDDGTVWSAGKNDYSKLGIGDGETRYAAVQVKGANGNRYLENVKSIHAGRQHSVAVKNDGTVWAWGSNGNGQFGTGNRTMSLYPKQLPIYNVKQAAVGSNYTVVLTEDGYVYTAGGNDRGQLGDGTKEDRTTFERVRGQDGYNYLSNIIAIAASDDCAMALAEDGIVWIWGTTQVRSENETVAVGNLTPMSVLEEGGNFLKSVSIFAGSNLFYAISASGELSQIIYYTNNIYQPTAVRVKGINGEGYFDNVVQISSGSSGKMVVCTDRKVYAWGYNEKGQFGTGDLHGYFETPVPAYTVNHVFDDHGDTAGEATPIEINSSVSGHISEQEDIDFFRLTAERPGIYQITTEADVNLSVYDQEGRRLTAAFDGYTLSAAETYSIAVSSYAEMDYTFTVELTLSPSHITTAASDYEYAHTMLYKYRNLYGAGHGVWGQLSTGQGSSSLPVQAVDQNDRHISDVKKLSAGDGSTFVLKKNGTVWAAGKNDYNKLGIPLAEDGNARNVSKAEQVCGEGGNGYLTDVTDISAGRTHTLALRSDGTVWAWGSSSHGQLGGGDRTMRVYPTKVPNLTDVIAVKAGDQTSMALKADGTVVMWGKNDQHQLGAGYTDNEVMTPVSVKGENGEGDLQNIQAIDMALKCSFALDADGQVWSWGNNTNGALGIGKSEFTSFPTKVVKEDGSPLTNMKAISAGNYHAGAVGYNGDVFMWGKNTSRQLGDRTRDDRYAAIQTTDTAGEGRLTNVQALSCGYEYTIAVQKDGTVLAWGYDAYGQFGLGTEAREMYDRPVPAFPMEAPPEGGGSDGLISIQSGQEYVVRFVGRNIKDFSRSFTISYNPSELEVLDLCAQTYPKELAAGSVNSNLTIEAFDPQTGRIQLKINREVPAAFIYSGVINMVKFRAMTTGIAKIIVSR